MNGRFREEVVLFSEPSSLLRTSVIVGRLECCRLDTNYDLVWISSDP